MRFLLITVMSLAVALGCSADANKKAAFAAADAACVFIEGATDDKKLERICATYEEFAPLVKLIARKRAYVVAHPDAIGGPVDICEYPSVTKVTVKKD